uniref:RecA family profile 1 domain-containing protein n=1 Tax=Ananas comosus var. bracteatus TaxID=296719 RepID=A0A6V7NUG7_ANACO|nr:unnamed protein product [Ananas comosus var. bracteatus]
MRSLRDLLHHRNLLSLNKARSLSISRSPSSNLPRGSNRSHESKHSHRRFALTGTLGRRDEPRVWYSSGCPDGSRSGWASYDPLSDQLLDREDERRSNSEEDERRYSEGDGSNGESASPVWAFYDPVAGRLVTRAAAGEEEPSRIDENYKSGKKFVRKDKNLKEDLSVSNETSRVSSGLDSNMRSPTARKKAGKVKVSFVCENCGASFGQWWGNCRSCSASGTLKKFLEPEVNKLRGIDVSEAVARAWLPQHAGRLVPQSLAEVNKDRDPSEWRIPLSGHFGTEVGRVLGGGIVPGSLVLVGGDPGVGKSTLLLQMAAIIAQGFNRKEPAPVVYVSGEESIEQIGNRADRMRITTGNLYLYSSTDIEDILDKIKPLSPEALIIDSIQTVYLRGIAGSAGNIVQVKECTSTLLRFAKQTNIPVLLIGHVTKTGDIAGPRILEHIVDAVLYMEGESYSTYRLLRSVKNRFGSTDELGVFEMTESGLQAVSDPSNMFLTEQNSDSEILTGIAVAVVVDGSRAFVIEVQALCVSGSSAARHVNGIQQSRSDMIISVLMKQAGLKLQDNAIFLNVVSGFKLTETAGDLAIAAAICSSFLEFPIPNDVAFIGEVGLGGELRTVSPRMDKRVVAIAKLGYKKCIVPKTAEKTLASLNLDIRVLGCRNLKEVINTVFQSEYNA